ncbi:hypothetical protein FUAX_21580 [Fulvitalea axinellae]|uniref:GSCFA domain-containing protein n=1 Tax=Fulvitalea axinellae TaxID=1182444 RepID=A0AAU9CC28_9BACT|nr:hypothetical protein FUAX_21580 [Fulvitalea axinellae]
MDFRAELVLPPSPWKLGLEDGIMTIGSCFSDVIGAHLSENKFRVLANPFGTLFNPLTIFRSLNDAIENASLEDEDFIERDGVHLNFQFHSDVFAKERGSLEKEIGVRKLRAMSFLKACKVIFITFGTSIVYHRKDSGRLVSNCHKRPAKEFERRMLSVNEITDGFTSFASRLSSLNPDCRIVLTVSPVRHLRDGMEANSLSKAVLRVACGELVDSFENVSYFPSYELVTDDLRDYRFFKKDLTHPNEMAEEYVWRKFVGHYFSEEADAFLRKWEKIKMALEHRPLHSGTESHQKFLMNTLKKLETLTREIDVEEEISQVKNELEKIK